MSVLNTGTFERFASNLHSVHCENCRRHSLQSYQRTRKSARSNTQRSSVPTVNELAQFSREGDRVCMLADRVAPETDCAKVAFAADTRG